MEEKIIVLMNDEHKRIANTLKEFEEILEKDLEKSKEIFSKFKWELEKHFFVEEKAIFIITDKIAGKEVSDIFDLMNEHGEIIQITKELEEDLEENIKPNTEKLKNLLMKHCKTEDEVFYPKLDQVLSSEQKQEISERIKEIIRG